MKWSIIPIALLVAFCAKVQGQEEDKVWVKRLLSPDQKTAAIYKGDGYGSGVVYISKRKVMTPLFDCGGGHLPQFKWLRKSNLSIRIYCGNPCWYERYYNTDTEALSPEFEYVLAKNSISELVVHVGEDDEILVSEMYSGKVRLRYKPIPRKCEEFLFFYRVKFLNPSTILVKCSEQSKVVRIPLTSASK